MFLPRYRYDNASSEYLVPAHASHCTVTGSANATSGVVTPFPLQTGHAPKELKVNNPAGCPVFLANMERILSMIPIYVANVERLEIPILFCPTIMVSGYLSGNSSNIKVLLPEPDTPQIETKIFLGIAKLIFFKLFVVALSIIKWSSDFPGCVLICNGWSSDVEVGASFSPAVFPW